MNERLKEKACSWYFFYDWMVVNMSITNLGNTHRY